MKYEYRDEPTVKLTGRSPEELEKKIEELEIKKLWPYSFKVF